MAENTGLIAALAVIGLVAVAGLVIGVIAFVDSQDTTSATAAQTETPGSPVTTEDGPDVIFNEVTTETLIATTITTEKVTTERVIAQTMEVSGDMQISGTLSSGVNPSARSDGAIEVTSKLAATQNVELGTGSNVYLLPTSKGVNGQVLTVNTETGTTSFTSVTDLKVSARSRLTLQNSQYTQDSAAIPSSGFVGAITVPSNSNGVPIILCGGSLGVQSSYSLDGCNFLLNADLNTKASFPAATFGHSPTLGTIVALNINNSFNMTEIHTSTDGLTWTTQTAPSGNTAYLFGTTTWVERHSLFLATNGIGSASTERFITSPDGITWTASTNPSMFAVRTLVDNGTIAVAGASGSNNLLWSTDLKTWTEATYPGTVTDVFSAAYSPEQGLWVATAQPAALLTSADGKTWIQASVPPAVFRRNVWIGDICKFLFTSDAGTLGFSEDGKTFTEIIDPPIAASNAYITYSPSFSKVYYGGNGAFVNMISMFTNQVGFAPTCGYVKRATATGNVSFPQSGANPPAVSDYILVTLNTSSFENFLRSDGSNGIRIPQEGYGSYKYEATLCFSIDTVLAAGTSIIGRVFNGAAFLDGSDASSVNWSWIARPGTANDIVTMSWSGTLVSSPSANTDIRLYLGRTDTTSGAVNVVFHPGSTLMIWKARNLN